MNQFEIADLETDIAPAGASDSVIGPPCMAAALIYIFVTAAT